MRTCRGRETIRHIVCPEDLAWFSAETKRRLTPDSTYYIAGGQGRSAEEVRGSGVGCGDALWSVLHRMLGQSHGDGVAREAASRVLAELERQRIEAALAALPKPPDCGMEGE